MSGEGAAGRADRRGGRADRRGGRAEGAGSADVAPADAADGALGEAGEAVGAGVQAEAEQAADGRAHGGEGAAEARLQPLVIRKRGRRVSTEPPPGYSGEPPVERSQSSENDARLKGDVPPHWG